MIGTRLLEDYIGRWLKMVKRKRRIHENLQRELWNIFYKIRPNDLLKQYQKYIKILCYLFNIPNIPEIRFCDAGSGRQGECIRLKGGKDPCGGGCYVTEGNKGIIYLRDHYVSQDLLLHELFHHINRINSNNQQNILWYAIQYKSIISHKTNFRKTIKEALNK